MSLTKLIEAVDRGEWPGEINGIARAVFPYNEDWRKDHGVMAHEAFDGSLDAAKRLHDALLPGWVWGMHSNGQALLWPPGTVDEQNAGVIEAEADGLPSRALLLCILRALEQEGR